MFYGTMLLYDILNVFKFCENGVQEILFLKNSIYDWRNFVKMWYAINTKECGFNKSKIELPNLSGFVSDFIKSAFLKKC